MRLLIIEPEAEGHHLVLYTRLLLEESLRRDWRVSVLTTESAAGHAAFRILSANAEAAFETIVIPDIRPPSGSGSLSLLVSQFRLWKGLAAASASNNQFRDFDIIYCVNLDYFEKALSLLGSPFAGRPFSGMLMNPKFHRAEMRIGPASRSDRLYSWLFRRLLSLNNLQSVLVVDERFLEFCNRSGYPNAGKMRFVPDVGELSDEPSTGLTRGALGIRPDALVVLLYGSLSRRKGVKELLQAIEATTSEEVVALVAGKPDEETQGFLRSERCYAMQATGKLVVRAGFQNADEERSLFEAADVVWLGYVGGAYGSSGVLYQAGSLGLPVIATDVGLIGWAVTRYDVGIALDPTEGSAVIDAIRRLRNDSDLRHRLGSNGRELAHGHTGVAFAKAICDALENSAGDASGPRVVTDARAS